MATAFDDINGQLLSQNVAKVLRDYCLVAQISSFDACNSLMTRTVPLTVSNRREGHLMTSQIHSRNAPLISFRQATPALSSMNRQAFFPTKTHTLGSEEMTMRSTNELPSKIESVKTELLSRNTIDRPNTQQNFRRRNIRVRT